VSAEGRNAEYVYLASPYSHASAEVRQARFEAVEHCAHWLLLRRNWVFAPIVHCHAIAVKYGLPKEFDYWEEYDKAMLMYARAIYVLCIDGWQESKGIAGELEFAMREGILIRYVTKRGDDYEVLAKP
jgi:hypothetical protein